MFDVDDVRQWLGEPHPEPVCQACGHADPGRVPIPGEWAAMTVHNRNGCLLCNHTGYGRPEDEPCSLFGVTVNAVYLRRFLRSPLVGLALYGRFWPAAHSTNHPHLFVIGKATLTVPSYLTTCYHPRYHPGVGSLWYLRNTNRRCVLLDWCQERGVELTELEGVPF